MMPDSSVELASDKQDQYQKADPLRRRKYEKPATRCVKAQILKEKACDAVQK